MSPNILVLKSDLTIAEARLKLNSRTRDGREKNKPELIDNPDALHQKIISDIADLQRRIKDLKVLIGKGGFQARVSRLNGFREVTR